LGVEAVDDDLEEVLARLDRDLPIVYPTSTLPALGVHPTPVGLDYLFDLKSRGAGMPVSLAVAVLQDAAEIVHIPESLEAFLNRLPKGSISVILPAKVGADQRIGGGMVAIRPAVHPVARALLERTGPLTATSANRSGETCLSDCWAAAESLGLPKSAVFPGDCPGGAPSTLIRWPAFLAARHVEDTPEILRIGVVTEEEVHAAWTSAT